MTTLNINGRRVKVDDSFLQLSPEQQEQTVNEIAQQMGVGAQDAQAQPSQSPSGPPSAVGDAFSSFAAGAGRGAADLIGLPGTIGDLARTGLQAGLSGGYRLATGAWPETGSDSAVERFFAGPSPEVEQALIGGGSMPLSGQKMRTGLSTVTGGATDYQPQTTAGEYTRTVGEFLPGALTLGGGGLLNAIRYGAVPALTSEAAGQLTEDTAFEPYARIAGALLGGYAGSRIGQPKAPPPPSAREIKQSAGYGDQMTDMLRNARTTDQTYMKITRDLWDDVKQAGTSYEVQQNFGRTIQNELKLAQQEGASLHSLERLRRALRSAGGGKLDTPNQAIANRLIDKLDAAVDNLSAANIAASGTQGTPTLDVLKNAREVYRTGKKAELVESAISNAQSAASGVENGLRNEFRRLIKGEKAANFNKVELDALKRIVNGDLKSNSLRFLGTFGFPVDQGRNWLGAMAGSSAAGSMAGSAFGPGIGTAVGAGVALGGTAARYGASKATQNLSSMAEALIKAGSRGQSAFAAGQVARQVAGREAALRVLLQSQIAGRAPYSREPERRSSR